MSVFKLPLQDFADIFITINNSDLKDHFLTPYEVAWLKAMDCDDYKTRENKLACWVERLHIANALAYEYQYNEHDGEIKITRLKKTDLDGGHLLPFKKLYEQLRSLRYNLHTNAGSSFVSPDDSAKLNALIEHVAGLIIWAA